MPIRTASTPLVARRKASTAPRVRRPGRACDRTFVTSSAIGAATTGGQLSNSSVTISAWRLGVLMMPPSAVTKIRKGNSAIRADIAMWLAIAQPSSSENRVQIRR